MDGETSVREKRRVLVVGSASLFGCAVGGLLESRGDGFDVASVKTVEAAIETAPKFRPDVIVFCIERDDLPSDGALNHLRLMDAYPARVIRCTLESNHLTIYDTKRITDATADDLLAAVGRGSEDSLDNRKGEGS
jgi:chemotaxis response regulator CheB